MENPGSSKAGLQQYTYNVAEQLDGGNDDHTDDNYMQILYEKEIANPILNDQEALNIINENWIQEFRTAAIHYILRTGERFQFRIHTVYTAVIYLDRFLATRTIIRGQNWSIRVIAAACLSMAAKMDESRDTLPSLSEYPMENFELNNNPINAIRMMEDLILDVLKWNIEDSRKDYIRAKTMEIIMSVLRDVRLMNYRPSVIAAAATLLALNQNLTMEELVIKALLLNGAAFLQIDNVCYCYYKLLELNKNTTSDEEIKNFSQIRL
ncbi:PREDICTED: cyclin-D5-3-like [Nicotiana attenuata]|uniref:cyclin-D5-3-like n=1 Tax=Nicotiana attenuata TaxID=49451 RepID=UPI000905730E|nr:PREDICTED: cyclin-D5-3-like [Nicotiana attenuata]